MNLTSKFSMLYLPTIHRLCFRILSDCAALFLQIKQKWNTEVTSLKQSMIYVDVVENAQFQTPIASSNEANLQFLTYSLKTESDRLLTEL